MVRATASVLALMSLPLIAGCSAMWPYPHFWPPYYRASAIEAHVADAETGAPLEAIIVAHWQLQADIEGFPVAEIMVMETVADSGGRFSFPPWGPKVRWPLAGRLQWKDPEVLVFKHGYVTLGPSDAIRHESNCKTLRISDWSGKTILLRRVRDADLTEYTRWVENFDGHLDFAFQYNWSPRYSGCEWKKIPRALLAMDQENEWLRTQGAASPGRPTSLQDRDTQRPEPNKMQCGSVINYVRGVGQ
jgi:hypothetical protein